MPSKENALRALFYAVLFATSAALGGVAAAMATALGWFQ